MANAAPMQTSTMQRSITHTLCMGHGYCVVCVLVQDDSMIFMFAWGNKGLTMEEGPTWFLTAVLHTPSVTLLLSIYESSICTADYDVEAL